MEEEQDRILLSTLGVQSANPEDIERHIFDKVIFLSSTSLKLIVEIQINVVLFTSKFKL